MNQLVSNQPFNIVMNVAYDGGAYLGWQKTPMGPSIEENLENALSCIFQQKISLQAASRTDAGVHADSQVVNFFLAKIPQDFSRLLISINSLLPKDISVISVRLAPTPQFHPTLDCIGKEYHYYLCTHTVQLPKYRYFSWHCHTTLDLSLMQQAAQKLTGRHNFAAFCNVRKNACYEDYIREIYRITIVALENGRVRIEVEGNHFLYKMVRNLVGTLVYIGKGKLTLHQIDSILASKDRKQAGVTAPSHGLSLYKVRYS